MSIEEQVQIIKRVKQQAAGFEANPKVLREMAHFILKDVKVGVLMHLSFRGEHLSVSCVVIHISIRKVSLHVKQHLTWKSVHNHAAEATFTSLWHITILRAS